MLIKSFPLIRRKRRRTKAAGSPVTVTVVAATVVTNTLVEFEFNLPVTTDGTGSSFIVLTDTNIGAVSADSSDQISANVVRFAFSGMGLNIQGGETWEINDVPACLDLNGKTMVVPQTGAVGV